MKTFSAKPETVKRDWFVVDANGQTLGRLATEVARRLRGKHKPEYTPHVDTGDYIVIVNADKITVTGNKAQAKMYYHHTGFPGGIKTATAREVLAKKPEELIRMAVKGMWPFRTRPHLIETGERFFARFGAAAVKRFAHAGWRVIATGRRGERLHRPELESAQ